MRYDRQYFSGDCTVPSLPLLRALVLASSQGEDGRTGPEICLILAGRLFASSVTVECDEKFHFIDTHVVYL